MNTTLDIVYRTAQGTPVTDSLKVAQVFGKSHKNILRAIKDLIETTANDRERTEKKGQLKIEPSPTDPVNTYKKWFYETAYTNSQNKRQPIYVMTRDGFSLLAMGFTGEKALRFKVAFINKFNDLEKQIATTSALPQNFAEALRLAADQAEKLERQRQQMEQDKPKVQFANALLGSTNSCLIGQLAKILTQNGFSIGQNNLFRLLRDEGYLCKSGERRNLPTQQYVEQKLFEIKTSVHSEENGVLRTTYTPKVTPKGQEYFLRKFLHNELSPHH